MEIIPIFGKKLLAIRYPEEEKDEFIRLFELWNDIEYLEEFFDANINDLQSGFWEVTNVEDAIFETYNCANEFEQKLLNHAEESKKDLLSGLEDVFKPLHDNRPEGEFLVKSKAKSSWLRIYAIRIEANVFVITGGAIKLTQTMGEREHTEKELRKLERSRDFLKEHGILDSDGLIEEIES